MGLFDIWWFGAVLVPMRQRESFTPFANVYLSLLCTFRRENNQCCIFFFTKPYICALLILSQPTFRNKYTHPNQTDVGKLIWFKKKNWQNSVFLIFRALVDIRYWFREVLIRFINILREKSRMLIFIFHCRRRGIKQYHRGNNFKAYSAFM